MLKMSAEEADNRESSVGVVEGTIERENEGMVADQQGVPTDY
jgi:hypothetical protein